MSAMSIKEQLIEIENTCRALDKEYYQAWIKHSMSALGSGVTPVPREFPLELYNQRKAAHAKRDIIGDQYVAWLREQRPDVAPV